jgi:hypothetical protein
VDHDHGARVRERREVGRAQQGFGVGGAERQDELLPRVAGAVDEPRPRLEDLVGAGPQRRKPGGELARPALDPAELGAGGGASVDGDAVTGQRA